MISTKHIFQHAYDLTDNYGKTGNYIPCIVFPLIRFGTLYEYIVIINYLNFAFAQNIIQHKTKKGKMPDDEVANISYQIANATHFLQSYQWAHCDLKPGQLIYYEFRIVSKIFSEYYVCESRAHRDHNYRLRNGKT